MLGWIRWSEEHKIRFEQELILGLPLLVLYLPKRERGQERRVRKGAHLLTGHRVTRVLTPPQFAWWPILTQMGLRTVETQSLRCRLAPTWVRAVMTAAGIRAEQAVLRLSGSRETPDMALAAHRLCPLVRNIVIDVPNGEHLAAQLRREYGLPILPVRSTRVDLTLYFDSGPVLEGAAFVLDGENLPTDCETLPLLSVLWECGRVKTEDIKILV